MFPNNYLNAQPSQYNFNTNQKQSQNLQQLNELLNLRQQKQYYQESVNTQETGLINLKLFGILFSEYLVYCTKQTQVPSEIEQILISLGRDVGARLWELHMYQERNTANERYISTKNQCLTLQQVLNKIKDRFWTFLFGHSAVLKVSQDSNNLKYYITEATPVLDHFISYHRGNVKYLASNIAAGIIQAALDGCGIAARVETKLYDGDSNTYFQVTPL